jgi:nickel-type superoxide dismutase maturation protease
MTPLLNPGEEVLIDPGAYHRCPPQPGDLVVATHPRDKSLRLIKWVVYVDQQACFLKGINATASTDSREFGLVPFKTLMGKVVCRFP